MLPQGTGDSGAKSGLSAFARQKSPLGDDPKPRVLSKCPKHPQHIRERAQGTHLQS